MEEKILNLEKRVEYLERKEKGRQVRFILKIVLLLIILFILILTGFYSYSKYVKPYINDINIIKSEYNNLKGKYKINDYLDWAKNQEK